MIFKEDTLPIALVRLLECISVPLKNDLFWLISPHLYVPFNVLPAFIMDIILPIIPKQKNKTD